MRHYPGINHENIESLYLSEVKALLELIDRETR